MSRTIILAGMVLCAGANAGSDIVKCVESDGSVTLTDAQCPSEALTMTVVPGNSEADDGAQPRVLPASAERSAASRQLVRHDVPLIKRTGPGGGLARDVATLKLARQTMNMMDNASLALRAQQMASLR